MCVRLMPLRDVVRSNARWNSAANFVVTSSGIVLTPLYSTGHRPERNAFDRQLEDDPSPKVQPVCWGRDTPASFHRESGRREHRPPGRLVLGHA